MDSPFYFANKQLEKMTGLEKDIGSCLSIIYSVVFFELHKVRKRCVELSLKNELPFCVLVVKYMWQPVENV